MGIYVYPNQKTERNRASGNKMPPLSLIEGDNFFHGTHFVNSYMRNICLFNRNSRLFSVSWFALWGQPGHSKNYIAHFLLVARCTLTLSLSLLSTTCLFRGCQNNESNLAKEGLLEHILRCYDVFAHKTRLYLVLFFIPLGSDSFALKTLNWQWLINMHCTCIQVH